MASPRTEPTPARGNEEKHPRDAQPATADAAPKATPSGAWKAWLPLVVTMLVMPLVAYGVTIFILVPRMQKSLTAAGVTPAKASAPTGAGAEGAGNEATAQGGQRQNVTLNKLLVNVAGTMGSRYLLFSISAVSTDPTFQQKMTENDAALKDMACSALSVKTLADLEKPDERNLIRTQLLNGMNNILGANEVQELYLTEFGIQ